MRDANCGSMRGAVRPDPPHVAGTLLVSWRFTNAASATRAARSAPLSLPSRARLPRARTAEPSASTTAGSRRDQIDPMYTGFSEPAGADRGGGCTIAATAGCNSTTGVALSAEAETAPWRPSPAASQVGCLMSQAPPPDQPCRPRCASSPDPMRRRQAPGPGAPRAAAAIQPVAHPGMDQRRGRVLVDGASGPLLAPGARRRDHRAWSPPSRRPVARRAGRDPAHRPL